MNGCGPLWGVYCVFGLRESVLVSKKLRLLRNGSYLVGRRSDQVYNSDQGLVGAAGLAVYNRHHNHTAAGLGDCTGAVRVGTSRLPAAIRNLCVL